MDSARLSPVTPPARVRKAHPIATVHFRANGLDYLGCSDRPGLLHRGPLDRKLTAMKPSVRRSSRARFITGRWSEIGRLTTIGPFGPLQRPCDRARWLRIGRSSSIGPFGPPWAADTFTSGARLSARAWCDCALGVPACAVGRGILWARIVSEV